MKNIILGICTLMLVTSSFAGDTKKPAAKAKAKTECTPTNCKDPKSCKDPKDCKDKACAKTCTPSCSGK